MLTQLNVFIRLSVLLLLVSVALPAWATGLPADNDAKSSRDIVGAVCIIRHDNQMIMLSEVITKKFALPGGYIERGDSPKEAAIREVLEETGIDVEVAELLQYRERAAIFSCVAKTPILVSSFKDRTGYPIVASWFAKDYSVEVKRVYLANPNDIAQKDYRYPDDAPLLNSWLERTPNSEIEIYRDLLEQVNPMHKLELSWIQQLQSTVRAMPDASRTILEAIVYLGNLPGEPIFIALLIIFVAGFFGPHALLQLAVLLFVAIFTANALKLGFASPRPSDIMPELQQANAYGYGFPSMHTLLATILWGMCWQLLSLRIGRTFRWLSLPLFLSLVVLMALARVWYGVHFISDTLASVLLGIVMVAMMILWHGASSFSLHRCISDKWFWFYLTMLVGITAALTFTPSFAYLFALLLGIFLAVDWLPKHEVAIGLLPKALTTASILVGIILINFCVKWLAAQASVSLIVLSIRCCGFAFAGLWLVAGSSILSEKIAAKFS